MGSVPKRNIDSTRSSAIGVHGRAQGGLKIFKFIYSASTMD